MLTNEVITVQRVSTRKETEMVRYLSPFLILTMICGCAVVTSTRTPLTQPRAETTAAYYFLPKTKIRIQVLYGNNTHGLKFVETTIIPDESEFFLLDYKKSALSNDNLTIQLTADGLLKKVETTVEDKSGEVIVKLAEVGKEVAKAAVYVSSVGETPQVVRDLTFSPSELSEVNSKLAKITPEKLRIDLVPMAPLSPLNKGGDDRSSPGVCFRPQIPYKLRFFKDGAVVEQRILLLPDGAPKICMPIERSAFVKKVTNLTFDKGVLTEVHIEKPSEVLGFMDIPISISKAIASIPAELVQIKINYSNKEKDLANARRAELEAKEALLEYQKKEQEEREKNNTSNPLDYP
jgi:hypothetical protein